MGKILQMFADRLTNIMSGMGTTADKNVGLFYNFIPVTPQQAEAAYRTSWIWRKLIDIPAKDMTREWRDWKTTKDKIELLEAAERKLQLRARAQRCIILARLFGGAGLVLGTDDPDPSLPLDVARVRKDGLRYVRAMSRYQLVEGPPIEDPLSPWVDEPEHYTISSRTGQTVKLHPSRVVPFIGQKSPEGGMLAQASWFWGDPVMQSVGEAVKNADLAQAGFAALIDEAKIDVIKMPDLMSTWAADEHETQFLNRMAAANLGKSSYRQLWLDKDEEWEQRQMVWAGIPEALMAFLQIACGAADIPVTRFLSQSPKGLQSTGEGEERNYHEMVKAWQEDLLEPALDRVDEVLLPSVFGSVPTDVYYEFSPLSQLGEKEAAEVDNKNADTFKKYADTGLLPDGALAEIAANQIIECGRFPGSEAAFEKHRKELENPDTGSEEELLTLRQKVAGMQQRGAVTNEQADRLITDARPRTLYVSRKLLNGAEFIKWAKRQGFETTVPADELHVTVLFSRAQVDWIQMGSAWDEDEQGRLRVKAGGARLVEKLGDKGAIVLLFNSSSLAWRHEEMVRNGASHDFESYQPHVTITYAGSDIDLEKVEPYRGELVFGPEIFEEVTDDWEKSLTEA